MFITAIDLDTPDLAAERAFYTDTLGLPLRQESADSFSVQAGTTALAFHASTRSSLLYHLISHYLPCVIEW